MIRRFLHRRTPRELGPPKLPAPDERLYVVGDIHGRFDLLKALMAKLAEDHDSLPRDGRKPRLIFLGDYVDRGDRSRDVLEALVHFGDDAIMLKGNHEVALLNFLDDPEGNRSWLRFGGLQTLASYHVPIPSVNGPRHKLRDTAAQLREHMGRHADFLRTLPLSYLSGNVLCTHAGVDPSNPMKLDEEAMLWGRSEFVEMDGVDDFLVVHGHYDAPEPVVTQRRICLDTGAYYSGRLTAARIDDGVKLISVDVMNG
ncbi:metallophosphoesterase family protein [Tropicimonas marinistellae]|uniref:metallophosphoesterase family protein n=1 Tax=Tropicimonas marinistellae TaxID=1739787 RepID=UPI00082C1038|nr:metallophosphoesterase family protein [Tropicimonas marinistellae]